MARGGAESAEMKTKIISLNHGISSANSASLREQFLAKQKISARNKR
jgi:hypothetical protein